jgi:ATP-dependent DNA ligase
VLEPPLAPMLAATTPALPEPSALPGGCLYQPKFDGYRALIFHSRDRVDIQSRAGNLMTSGFPDIAAAVTTQLPPGVVLDGELVVWDGTGVNFTSLAGRLGATRKATRLALERPATFMVFDLLAVEGIDIRRRPLSERLDLLAAVLTDARPPLQMVPTTNDVTIAREWLDDYAAAPHLGLEGVVIKAAAGPYGSGKRGWLKYRVRQTYDVVVGAISGSIEAPTRLVLGYYDHPTATNGPLDGPLGDLVDGLASPSLVDRPRLQVAGSTIPLGRRQARAVAQHLAAADDEHPWPERMPSRWVGDWASGEVRLRRVQPTLVVEVSADTAFEYGRWRHQVRYMRIRPDKDPGDSGRPHPIS